MTALMALLGAGVAAGVLLVAASLTGSAGRRPLPRPAWWRPGRWRLRLALSVTAGLAVGLASRWPVAALLATALGWALPSLLGAGGASAKASVRKAEAVAVWVENVRDTMAGGAQGLAQAIIATAPSAPEAIAAEVGELAGRLARQEPLPTALRRFAAELADPSADQAVIAMLLVADPRQKFGGLGEALTELASATRAHVAMRLRVEVGRTRIRAVARFIVLWTAGFIGVELLFTREYLSPYDAATGQLVLAMIGGVFVAAFWWLHRMAGQLDTPQRFLETNR